MEGEAAPYCSVEPSQYRDPSPSPNAGCVALFATSSSGTCRLRRPQFVVDGVIMA
jgi:hypothetical protein